jgi:hypothetical protein
MTTTINVIYMNFLWGLFERNYLQICWKQLSLNTLYMRTGFLLVGARLPVNGRPRSELRSSARVTKYNGTNDKRIKRRVTAPRAVTNARENRKERTRSPFSGE